jgi:hypothetical protein
VRAPEKLACVALLVASCSGPAPAPGARIALLNGVDLAGWRAVGDAQWTVVNGELLGETGGGSQSFLISEREFGDFTLELELRNEAPGNSGVQFRSHQRENGRVFGYQIEVDPSARAWSGGLYHEAGRGWLASLADKPEARAAFALGEWNHYRIEAVGPRIRTWVNGVPAVDFTDLEAAETDARGFLALQVHSGQDTKVRWRNLMLIEHAH